MEEKVPSIFRRISCVGVEVARTIVNPHLDSTCVVISFAALMVLFVLFRHFVPQPLRHHGRVGSPQGPSSTSSLSTPSPRQQTQCRDGFHSCTCVNIFACDGYISNEPILAALFVIASSPSLQVDHQLVCVEEIWGVVVVGRGAIVAPGQGVAGQGPLQQLALRPGS